MGGSMITTARAARVSRSRCWPAARCPRIRASPISKYNPGRYQNHTVTVDGVVTSSWGVPLVPFKLYKVDDGTGEVTVVSQDGRVPTRGARVRVKGASTSRDVRRPGGRSAPRADGTLHRSSGADRVGDQP